jgi:hypothetical protein
MSADYDDDEPRRRRRRAVMEEADEDHDVVRRQRRRASGTGGFSDFALFRTLIAPWVLIVLYWVGVAACMLAGMLLMVLGPLGGGPPAEILGFVVLGILLLVLGPVLLRINFEFIIVVFRIYAMLVEIRDNTSRES